MFDELKNIPNAQKKLIRRAITMTSALFLCLAAGLWIFKEQAITFLGMDEFMVSIVAGLLCLMVAVDLILVKYDFWRG